MTSVLSITKLQSVLPGPGHPDDVKLYIYIYIYEHIFLYLIFSFVYSFNIGDVDVLLSIQLGKNIMHIPATKT